MSGAVYSAMSTNASDEHLEKLSNNVQQATPPPSTPRSSRRRISSMGIRLRMFALFIVAVAIMVGHDQLYLWLRRRSLSANWDVDRLQSVANHVGNTFALLANILLSAAIGIAFVQVFWMRVRRKAHSIAEIDAAMSVRNSPFGLGSWRAWRAMFLLTLIPVLGFSNIHIVILGSGAMHVNFSQTESQCRMLNVNLTNAHFEVVTPDASGTSLTYSSPEAQLKGFVTQVVSFNTTLTPLIIDNDIFSYPLRFDAPGLNCTDITSAASSSVLLAPDGLIPVWNTAYQLGGAGDTLNFTSTSQDLTTGVNGGIVAENNAQSVQCLFYNVTYDILVNYTDSNVYESIIMNKTWNAPLVVGTTTEFTTAQLEFDSLADTFGRTLNGTAAYDPNTFDFTPESPIIVYSQFGEGDPKVPWSLKNLDMTLAIPALMDAVSVSLLSDILNTAQGEKPVERTVGDCVIQNIAFQYSRTRLLVSYGVGLLYTAICIAIGCYAIRVNGVEETMDFSRIMRSVVHPGLYEHKDDLARNETLLQADQGEVGEFRIRAVQIV